MLNRCRTVDAAKIFSNTVDMSRRSPELENTPAAEAPQVGNLFHPWWPLRNGHVQTLAGTYVFGRWTGRRALPQVTLTLGEVAVDDGDRLVYLDDCPPGWRLGDPVVLLLHGLSGDHNSPYMRRIASKFYRRQIRVVRLDWRGSGAGMKLARYPYHSGRSADLLAAVEALQDRIPDSPLNVVGFSMGGNILLKLLGEVGAAGKGGAGISKAIAVCPPIDLVFTIDSLQSGLASLYDRFFAKACFRDVCRRQQQRPDAVIPDGWFARRPRTLREFDESFTAPVCGFASANDYYIRSGAIRFLSTIAMETLIIATADDPVIPFDQFVKADYPPHVKLHATRHGGHMGFVTARGSGWMDDQILSWILNSRSEPNLK